CELSEKQRARDESQVYDVWVGTARPRLASFLCFGSPEQRVTFTSADDQHPNEESHQSQDVFLHLLLNQRKTAVRWPLHAMRIWISARGRHPPLLCPVLTSHLHQLDMTPLVRTNITRQLVLPCALWIRTSLGVLSHPLQHM
ncbi:hypothetical protein HPB47_013476, partial [Ixodes persulcatus]